MKRIFVLLTASVLWLNPVQAFQVPKKSEILKGYDETTCRQRLSARALDPLEGIWYYPDEQMKIAIDLISPNETAAETHYRLTVIEAEDCSIDCGCVAGYMEKTAEPETLKLWLYSAISDGLPKRPIECVATVNSSFESILIDRPKIKLRFSMNIAQFFPTLFRGIRIYPRIESKTTKPGFVKIYPTAICSENNKPVYF